MFNTYDDFIRCPFARHNGVHMMCEPNCLARTETDGATECRLIKQGADTQRAIEQLRDVLQDINTTLQYRLT